MSGNDPEFVAQRYDRLAGIYRAIELAFGLRARVRTAAVNALELRPGETVLEIGCGSGGNCERLVERVGEQGRVVGIDVSAGMLRRAEALCRRHEWTNVTLLRQDATRLEVTGPLDGVLFSLSYSVLPERRATLEKARGLLRSGGRLVIMDAGLPPGRVAQLLNPAMEVLSRATVLGDPLARPWEDLKPYGRVETKRFRSAPYYVCAVTPRDAGVK